MPHDMTKQEAASITPTTCQFNQKLWVKGKWVPLYSITSNMKLTTSDQASKDQAAESMKQIGASAGASVGLEGVGMEASVEGSLENGFTSSISSAQSNSFELDLEPEAGSSYLWTFQYTAHLRLSDGTTSKLPSHKSEEYALTGGLWQTPKCYPGWALDIPKYQKCQRGGEVQEDGVPPSIGSRSKS